MIATSVRNEGHFRRPAKFASHTGTWFCLYRGPSLAEALKTIETDGLLHPCSVCPARTSFGEHCRGGTHWMCTDRRLQ